MTRRLSVVLALAACLVVALGYPAASEKQAQNDTLTSLENKLLAQNEEFYNSLDEKQKEEVNKIVEDQSLTKAQFKEKIQQWVDQLPEDKKVWD